VDQNRSSPNHYIREWRRHRGLTQAQLADAIAVHRGHLNKIECGRRYHARPVVEAIAARLDCEPNDLIRRHPSHTSELETLFRSLSAEERSRALDLLKTDFARSRSLPQMRDIGSEPAPPLTTLPIILIALLRFSRFGVQLNRGSDGSSLWFFRFSPTTVLEVSDDGAWTWRKGPLRWRRQIAPFIGRAEAMLNAARLDSP